MSELSDEDLIGRTADGDGGAFNQLAERHMGYIYAVAFRMSASREMAEEITQEVLIRVWRKAGMWQADKGASVKTWIYRIVHNACVDMMRKRKNNIVPLHDRHADDAPGPEKNMQGRQTGAIVRDIIKALPVRQREALVLCHYQGLSNAEAAGVLGTSVKGVEGLLVRARQTVRAGLEKQQGVL